MTKAANLISLTSPLFSPAANIPVNYMTIAWVWAWKKLVVSSVTTTRNFWAANAVTIISGTIYHFINWFWYGRPDISSSYWSSLRWMILEDWDILSFMTGVAFTDCRVLIQWEILD